MTNRRNPEERKTDALDVAGREVWGVLLGFLTLGLLAGLFALLFRMAVPSVLASTVPGATLMAMALAMFGSVGIVVLALFLFSRIARLFSK